MRTTPGSGSYHSDYGGGEVSASQKLAEVACARKARGEGRTLGTRFWGAEPWASAFRAQVRHACALLKLFDDEAVFAALRAEPGLWSLGSRPLREAARAEQGRLDAARRRAADAAPPETSPTDAVPRPGAARGRSVLSKLKDI